MEPNILSGNRVTKATDEIIIIYQDEAHVGTIENFLGFQPVGPGGIGGK